MRVLEELQEDVFRFRVQHRYDHRFLFLVFDLFWSAAKLALFIAFTYALWLAGMKALSWLEISSASPLVTPRAVVVSDEPTVATGNEATVSDAQLQSTEIELGNQVVEVVGYPQPSDGELEPAVSAALPKQSLQNASVEFSDVSALAVEEPGTNTDGLAADGATVTEIPALARPAVNPNATVFEEDWILSQPARNFTIQIGSTANLLFLRRLGLMLPGNHERAVYHYKTSADGQAEYGLAWGVFESVAAAQAELAGLDDYSKRYGPWIRRLQGIQLQVKSR